MGLLSRFEGKMEDTVEGAAEIVGGSSLSPVQITKKAEKQMRREKIVGAGKQYAPTLYTILVSNEDDRRLFQYYPTLAGEVETFLMARAQELGFVMDGQPLVRFIADPDLKKGKFDVVAELVAASIVDQLRDDEMVRYGLAPASSPRRMARKATHGQEGEEAAGASPANLRPLAAQGRAAASAAAGVVGSSRAAKAARAHRAEVVEEDYAADEGLYPESEDIYEDYEEELLEEEPLPRGSQDDRGVQDYGAPVAPQSAQSALPEVYLYDEERDRAYHLTGLPQKIGRESANEISVPDINVSRVHAEIRLEPTSGMWMISDLGSTNGLYINGRKVSSAPLRDADMITLGTTTLEFQDLT